MAKEYFSHDYHTRSDQKIKHLIINHGMVGYGIFWSIIEDMYINANALRLDYDSIAFELRCEKDIVKSVICDFDLFYFTKEQKFFHSHTVKERLKLRNEKSTKARESANYRWGERNANALRQEYERNAIKGKEIKENKIKGKEIKEKDDPVFLNLFSNVFLEKWESWRGHRNLIKKPFKSVKSENMAMKELFAMAGGKEDLAEKIINKSIANGWQGLFQIDEPKVNGNAHNDAIENPAHSATITQLIEGWNQVTGMDFAVNSESLRPSIGRMLERGADAERMMEVVQLKYRQWKDDAKMQSMIRPSTIWGPKYEEYAAEVASVKNGSITLKSINHGGNPNLEAYKRQGAKIREAVGNLVD